MRTLVTGATGFTGEHVVKELLLQGSHQVVAFVRQDNKTTWLREQGVSIYAGDLTDQASLQAALQGVEVLLNVASLGFGHAANIVAAAEAARVRRAVFVSTTAIFTRLHTESKYERLEAERLIQESQLRYTILRPTMIYGTPRDRNIWRLINYLRHWPIIPVVGRGRALQQPVYVEDVAQAIIKCVSSDKAIGRIYNLAGSAPLSFLELIDTVCQHLKRSVSRLHIPVTTAQITARLLHPLGLSVTPEQVQRLNEDKTFDISPARSDLCYTPLSFSEGVTREIAYL